MKIGRPGEGVPAPIDPSRSDVGSSKTGGAKGPRVDSAPAGMDRVAEQREKALSSKAAEILKGAQTSQATGAARSTPEMIIGEVFEKALGRNPLASPAAPIGKGAAEAARQVPGFGEAVEAGRVVAADPENGSLVEDFSARVGALVSSGAGSEPLATLFHLFKDSMAEQNADKKYLLQKLKENNSVASALADYLRDLTGELGARSLQQPNHPKQEGVLSRGTSGETDSAEAAPSPPAPPDPGTGPPPSPVAPNPSDLSMAELRSEIARVKKEQADVQRDGEVTSTRLQTYVDRTAKLQDTMVHVMRLISDTQGDLIRRIQ